MDELKRLNRRTVFNGRAIDFCKDTMRLPDGRIEEWDFIHHKKGGGACVVPVLPDGRILLIRQMRPAIDRETLELPAGARDPIGTDGDGKTIYEDTKVTALRELREETGYGAETVTKLFSIKTAVAFFDEFTDVYLAENVQLMGQQYLDEAEAIRVVSCDMKDLLCRIYAGEIEDAKTVAGILAYAWYAEHRPETAC
ncbi:MAG: NUDIX hydrolase [Lachnospiraceae bacterium]|nr:NUDIX hydrolase [Lachnospiraceae bacterium]